MPGCRTPRQFDRPLVVVLSKLDEWNHLLDTDAKGDPWRTQDHVTGVDMDRIEHLSDSSGVMLHYCPETVAAAESFAGCVNHRAGRCMPVDNDAIHDSGLAGGVAKFPT